ncbi:MAG: alpha/beta hydrolase fold domain-containing protein [Planctomycetota bacterium]|nr:alpha/beta hydrolase fold domain-containing protein [Planctomycetota bacterium]
MIAHLVAAFALTVQDGAALTLANGMRAAIALAKPKERRTAALALARQKDATIDNVLATIDIVSRREPSTVGTSILRAPIFAADSVEDVELVVYVPKTYAPDVPAPLIATFHGTGGSGRGMDRMWRETAEKMGAVVVAPSEAGPNEGYLFSLREREAAIGAVRFACANFSIDTNRVYVTGISRGGHLAWDVALRQPDRFAALAPMIGCPRYQLVRGQNNLRFLENVVNVPIRDLQGSRDDPGVLQNLHEAFAKLEVLHARDAKLIEFTDRGHDFDFNAVDWPVFFSATRTPVPERVVFTSANLAEARSHFVEITQFAQDVAENPRIDVQAASWSKLDALGQRRVVQAQIDADTARIEVVRSESGRFEVTARGVAKFRLLLSREMFDASSPVEVSFNGKVTKRKVALDVKVLLAEFVERLDRSFLPVAVVEIP